MAMTDPKAITTASTGGITAFIGITGISDIAAIVGILGTIASVAIYWWSTKKRIEIQKDHNKEIENIQRNKDGDN